MIGTSLFVFCLGKSYNSSALCHDHFTAVMSRRHNNANALILGSRVTGSGLAKEILEAWLAEDFEGARHTGRLDKIAAYEEDHFTKLPCEAKILPSKNAIKIIGLIGCNTENISPFLIASNVDTSYLATKPKTFT